MRIISPGGFSISDGAPTAANRRRPQDGSGVVSDRLRGITNNRSLRVPLVAADERGTINSVASALL